MALRIALNTTDPGHTTWADGAACRASIRTGSRSFHLASMLLPANVRWPAHAMYAFCRFADDAVDEAGDPVTALSDLKQRLDLIYDGDPLPAPADRAFTDIVERFQIPRSVPDALMQGFQWDSQGRRYDSISDVVSYSVRVASTVGVMMTLVMGVRDRQTLARACDLGIAMQLTNIARDVGEDAREGRLYLPRAWLAEAGVDAEKWLRTPVHDEAITHVTGRLLLTADSYYQRCVSGIAMLPARCRPAINAARLIYAEIGRELERMRLNSVDHRAVTSTSRKLALLTRAVVDSALLKGAGSREEAPEACFLLDAVDDLPSRDPVIVEPKPLWNFSGSGGRMIDLMTRVHERQKIRPVD
ncbi:MAG: phytoene/squalene synthase family protein [Pseudomonadota bacterium]